MAIHVQTLVKREKRDFFKKKSGFWLALPFSDHSFCLSKARELFESTFYEGFFWSLALANSILWRKLTIHWWKTQALATLLVTSIFLYQKTLLIVTLNSYVWWQGSTYIFPFYCSTFLLFLLLVLVLFCQLCTWCLTKIRFNRCHCLIISSLLSLLLLKLSFANHHGCKLIIPMPHRTPGNTFVYSMPFWETNKATVPFSDLWVILRWNMTSEKRDSINSR